MEVQRTRRRRQQLPMQTLHHMTGKTDLGKVAGQLHQEPAREPQNGYEYDAFEAGAFVKGWVSNVLAGELNPVFADWSKRWLPDEQHPWLATRYGKVVRSRGVTFAANTAADIMAGPFQNLVRAVIHRHNPSLATKPVDGLGIEIDPANEIAASLVKTVATGAAKTWLMTAFAPPAPPAPAPAPKPGPSPKPSPGPAPAPAPGPAPAPSPGPAPAPSPGPAPAPKPKSSAPGGKAVTPGDGSRRASAAGPGKAAPQPGASPQSATRPHDQQPAATGPMFLGKDLKAIANETAQFGVSLVISKAYDQTVGPVVQKAINTMMGRGDLEVAKPKPMTPGGVTSALASAFLSSLVMRPVTAPAGGAEGAAGGAGGLLGTAIINGLIASAFDTVYSRSLGPAIAGAIDGAAGLPVPDRKPPTYTGERLVRTMARTAMSGTTYYLVDGMTQGFFASLGAQLGGGVGAFVAMAGPALLGMTAATAADGAVGGAVGSLAGSVYSWVTGKPKAEDRPHTMVESPAATADQGAAPAQPGAAAPALAPAPAPAAAPVAAAAGSQEAPAQPVVVSTAPLRRRPAEHDLARELAASALARRVA